MLLYHGSKVEVPYPDISYCNTHNDFGRGFYLTDDYDSAARWGSLRTYTTPPIVNIYEYDGGCYDLTGYSALEIVATVMEYRRMVPSRAFNGDWVVDTLVDEYAIPIPNCDAIYAPRYDDHYYGFIDFLFDEIPERRLRIDDLSDALSLIQDGIQYCVYNVNCLEFINADYVSTDWCRISTNFNINKKNSLQNYRRGYYRNDGTDIYQLFGIPDR